MASVLGGDKLEAALSKIAANVSKASKVDVGFLSDGIGYPNGTNTALVAFIQEFGAPSKGIPPRPFFRQMIAKESPNWPNLVESALKNTDNDTFKALSAVGQDIAGALQQSILTFDGVPLKPATIKAKGFSKQLVDTGHLSTSVGVKVT